MKLHTSQRILIQIYRRAANMADADYRRLLLANTGCRSSTQATWTQESYDAAMAALETILFERVAQGRVENPIGRDRYIRAEFYWRNKNPGQGYINSREVHKITQLWTLLGEYLPAENCSLQYFRGIVAKATGRQDIGLGRLTAKDAHRVIVALKDRLAFAMRKQPEPSCIG